MLRYLLMMIVTIIPATISAGRPSHLSKLHRHRYPHDYHELHAYRLQFEILLNQTAAQLERAAVQEGQLLGTEFAQPAHELRFQLEKQLEECNLCLHQIAIFLGER